MEYLALAGLVIIAAGWSAQYLSMKKAKKEIVKPFVALNCLGVLLLIIDGYGSGNWGIVAGNVLTFAGAALVLSRIK